MMRHIDLLIPPKRISKRPGVFTWPRAPLLASPATADVLPMSQLAGDLRRRLDAETRIVRNAFGPATVRIRRDKGIAGPERYRMEIRGPQAHDPAFGGRGGIEIAASTDAGAYYAVQTLRELLAVHGRRLPACLIEDWPDFRRRGVYHDCSRGKVPTVETLKSLVERLARWKINELQLYVENVFSFRRHPAIGRGYSPFTPRELLSLQEHCKRHHVRLVGSLASFGHMERILCLPEYAPLAELYGTAKQSGASTLCTSDPRSIRFVEELYEEFVPLFEAEDFNICGDETWDLGRGRSRRLAGRIGVGRLYLDFLRKLHRLCQKHGKRTNAWADIVLEHPEVLGDVPNEMVMLNWDYHPKGARIKRSREIQEAGLAFMVCPGTNAWQSHGSRMPMAMANVAIFAAEGRRCGAEGLLNTDWGDGGHRNTLGVSLHGFAHGAAHSWNGASVDDESFTERFCFHAFDQRDTRLAGALRLLGSAYRTVGSVDGNDTPLYHAFAKPFVPPEGLGSQLYRTSPEGCRKVIAQLGDPGIWPGPARWMDRFEALALREMALAAWMDVLACRKANLGRDILTGRRVPPAELRRFAAEMDAMAERFKDLWLARNKPSRLRDNLAVFRRAGSELRALAKT